MSRVPLIADSPPHASCRVPGVAGTRHASRILATLTMLSLPACTTEHVTAVDILSVRVEPVGVSAVEGEHHTFRAVVLDGKGVPVPGAQVDWSSGNPSVAAVDQNGTVEALREGSVEIRATFMDVWGSATVQVLPARKIAVAPDSISIVASWYDSSPDPEMVQVTNEGFGILSGLRVSVRYPQGPGRPWLKAELASATAPTTLTLTADPDRLGWGTHRATVLVTSDGVGNSPVEIPVSLTIRVFGAEGADAGSRGDLDG